eukprot:909205_1
MVDICSINDYTGQNSTIFTQNGTKYYYMDTSTLLEIRKSIILIYKSKIDHEYKKANCITNFILSSYAVLMPSYIHLNAANNKINIEYWYLHLFHEYYLVKNGVLFTKWLLKVMRIFVKTITLLRK